MKISNNRPQPIHIEAVRLILSAVYCNGPGLRNQFLFRKPGALEWTNFSAEIFLRSKDFIRAVIHIRQNGASYLRSISIPDIQSMAVRFLIDNFWYIKDGDFSRRPDISYAKQTTSTQRDDLARALANSVLFRPKVELTLYPLTTIRVTKNFDDKNFFLIKAADLSSNHISCGFPPYHLDPTQFPPMKEWGGRKYETASWLGVRSPTHLVSQKMASAIFGAVALTPVPRERYAFSGREMFGGRCTFNGDTYSTNLGGEPHTPPMMNDITLAAIDHTWLSNINNLFDADDKLSRSKIRALEYFYRAWFLDPRERFYTLCMSLDSLVNVTNGHTSEAVKYVKKWIPTVTNDHRLKLLMNLRGAVIHGAAPDAYESEHYDAYYAKYNVDPVYDLELIVAKCARESIFGNFLKVHAHPQAAIIAKLQADGKYPTDLDMNCIIAGDVL